MADVEPDSKIKKERSPSFPFISLKRAVERAAQLAEAHKRNPARVSTVATTWSYGSKSSGLLQTIAALKQYGLIEDMGGGDDRKIQIADLGWRILHDDRPGAREQAIREAALRPRLMAELAEQWLPSRPGDRHCLSELHIDRGFTLESARVVLRVFDETVSFANLQSDDNLSESTQAPDATDEQRGKPLSTALHPVIHGTDIDRPAPYEHERSERPEYLVGARYTFPLPEGLVVLELPPMALSTDSCDEMEDWLKLMMRRARRGMKLAASPPAPPSD